MKLAASNIGWAPESTPDILPRLANQGVEGLVIAPTMVWQEAPYVSEQQATDFRKQVEENGLTIVGMQSLTFGLEGAALSGETTERANLAEHLKRQSELAHHLGAISLIFGSPGFRKVVDYDQAVSVFADVAKVAADNGNRLCIEPLSGYGNKFIQTTHEGVVLVERVQHESNADGFGLHLDAAAIAGSDYPEPLQVTAAHKRVGIASFDASAPELLSPSLDSTTPHRKYAHALRDVQYDSFVSLEMRQPDVEDPVKAFLDEVAFVYDQYVASK